MAALYMVNTRNRILSQNLRMSMDTRHTDRNNNILVVGGSGAGKTFRFVKPQLLQLNGSYICTDPKGELLRDTAGFFAANGWDVKVLNLLNTYGMIKSTHYNPFRYMQTDTDVLKLVTTFMENTKKKEAMAGEQFWEDMAALRIQAFFYYVRDIGIDVASDGNYQHNMKAFMWLVNKDKVEEDPRTGARLESEIDRIFKALEDQDSNHPAVLAYNKSNVGAVDTVRSVISTVNSRTTCLNTPEILELLSDDEIDIQTFGTKKTILYCVIPDNDKTYNFLIGMLYSQMFQQLYYCADFLHGGQLPVSVTFMLDEFANVALPDDFLSLLSTMRSRNISSIIIVQDLSQLKTLYKDGQHESILANCDTWVYLGGNGPSTQKELSEMMGKMTLDKKTSGETLGQHGSASRNYDVLGRELMFPDELRKLNGKKCVVFLRGYDVFLDQKIDTPSHPLWASMIRASGYEYDARLIRANKRKKEEKGLYDYAQYRQLVDEDQHEQKRYLHEKEVAEAVGWQTPRMPDQQVFELNLMDLPMLLEELENAPEEQPYQFDSEMIQKNRARAVERIEERRKKEEEEQKKKVDVSTFSRPEEALLFGRALKAGFEEEKIRLMLDLYQQTDKYSVDDILETFSPEMEVSMVKELVRALARHR